MEERAIRFAVTDGSEKRAATWKCWTLTGKGKNDVYIACRELGGALHASLHESGAWHIAFSKEFFAENQDAFADRPHGRFIDTWPRPSEIAAGVTLAFRIITPYSAVNIPIVPSNESIFWIPAPPIGDAVEIDILITSPHALVSSWPGKNSMNTNLVGSLLLDSDDKVWVVHRVISVPNFGNMTGTPTYFKGSSKEDLTGEGLRILVFGQEADGSCVIIDSGLIKDN